jgi:hypothetical protein
MKRQIAIFWDWGFFRFYPMYRRLEACTVFSNNEQVLSSHIHDTNWYHKKAFFHMKTRGSIIGPSVVRFLFHYSANTVAPETNAG